MIRRGPTADPWFDHRRRHRQRSRQDTIQHLTRGSSRDVEPRTVTPIEDGDTLRRRPVLGLRVTEVPNDTIPMVVAHDTPGRFEQGQYGALDSHVAAHAISP